MTHFRLLAIFTGACLPACGGPTTGLGSVASDLTVHAEVSARGRDGFITVDLKLPAGACPSLTGLAADADSSAVYPQDATGAAACTLPSFRGPLPQPASQDLVLTLKDSAGTVTLAARAVYGGRTLKLTSATAGALHAGEEATAEWQEDQFALVAGTTPLVELRDPSLNEGGAQAEVLSVTGTSVRFKAPALAAGHYKLALDGAALPTLTRCEGAKRCELVLDASELAAVPVDLL